MGVRHGGHDAVSWTPSGHAPVVGGLGSRRRDVGRGICPRWATTSRGCQQRRGAVMLPGLRRFACVGLSGSRFTPTS
jgi:hypothetical protein